jgi:pyridoxal biosynthesis lyase PdxS
MKSIKNKHTYLVIDTWNGMGYSTENGVEIKQFNDKQKASDWAFYRCLKQAQDDLSSTSRIKNGYAWEDEEGDAGTYQVIETKDVYAVMIKCNINDVETLTKEEYYDKIQELDKLYGEHLEYFLSVDKNGDRFYHSHADPFDYQFRLIENIKQFVEVHTTECYECAQDVEYTDVLPYCPNCLTNLG